MRKIDIADKAQIKHILRARGVLGIASSKCQQAGALQLWWLDMEDGVCNRCESSLSVTGIDPVNLAEALKTLWRNRNSLYLCGKYRGNGHKHIAHGLAS